MRIISYLILMFALVTQGALARSQSVVMPMASDNIHAAMMVDCHSEQIDSSVLMSHHRCCEMVDDVMQCSAVAEQQGCGDACDQCQFATYSPSLASSIISVDLHTPQPSASADGQSLLTRFWGVPTPPPSA